MKGARGDGADVLPLADRIRGIQVAQAQRLWQLEGENASLRRVGSQTLFVEPGSPRENGYVESFNGTLRDELLEREIFYTLWEAQVLIERWRRTYNEIRPHSSLGYRPPAPATIIPRSSLPNHAARTAIPMEVLMPRLT